MSEQQYAELCQQMQAIWDALSIAPECVCCIVCLSAVYVGLPLCGWVLYTSCEINKRMNAVVEAAGWGKYKMIEAPPRRRRPRVRPTWGFTAAAAAPGALITVIPR